MLASRQIRGLIALYLDDLIDLSLFADRFSDISENIENSKDSAAIQLSYQVEALLAKASDGYISQAEFLQGLRDCHAGFSATTNVIEKAPAKPAEAHFKSFMVDSGELMPV
jgi:hypothetical protein